MLSLLASAALAKRDSARSLVTKPVLASAKHW